MKLSTFRFALFCLSGYNLLFHSPINDMTNFQPYKDILFYKKVVALKAVLLDRGLAHE